MVHMEDSANQTKPIIALVSSDANDTQDYLTLLISLGADVRHFGSIIDLKIKSGSEHYHGLAIDFKTALQSSPSEKIFFSEQEAIFPVIRLGKDPANNQIIGIVRGHALDTDQIFPFFVHEKCREFPSRGIRRDKRERRHLSVWVSDHSDMEEASTIKAVTMDVSTGGLFIISITTKPLNEIVWIRVKEFEDSSPVRGTVCWGREWGKTIWQVPGYGIRFDGLSDSQHADLLKFMAEKPKEL